MGVLNSKKDWFFVGFMKDGLNANDGTSLQTDDKAMVFLRVYGFCDVLHLNTKRLRRERNNIWEMDQEDVKKVEKNIQRLQEGEPSRDGKMCIEFEVFFYFACLLLEIQNGPNGNRDTNLLSFYFSIDLVRVSFLWGA